MTALGSSDIRTAPVVTTNPRRALLSSASAAVATLVVIAPFTSPAIAGGWSEMVVPTAPPTSAQTAATTAAGVLAVAGTATAPSAEETPEPQWLAPALRDLHRIGSLRRGWDTYGAKRPDTSLMLAALGFLTDHMGARTAAPSIVPLADGGVQLEWHSDGADVEITFPADGAPELYFTDVATGQEWEGPAGPGFERLHLAQRLRDAGR